MWMDNPEIEEEEVTAADLVRYWRPRDILQDGQLTIARKRELIASWASDIHAVNGSPALRCARGVTVHIDELLDALKELDGMVDATAISRQRADQTATN